MLAPRLVRLIKSSSVRPKLSSLKAHPKLPSGAGYGKIASTFRSEIVGTRLTKPSRLGCWNFTGMANGCPSDSLVSTWKRTVIFGFFAKPTAPQASTTKKSGAIRMRRVLRDEKRFATREGAAQDRPNEIAYRTVRCRFVDPRDFLCRAGC